MKLFAVLALTLAASAAAAPAIQTTIAPEYAGVLKLEGFVNDVAALASSCHYEDPFKTQCQSGEVNITITGIPGSICTPRCDEQGQCPTDLCQGVTATPTCALQDQQGNKYCALICNPGAGKPDKCATDEHMACHAISGTGVCTWYS